MSEVPNGIPERMRDILARIDAAAKRAGRDPSLVRLVGVTKTVSPQGIRAAYDAGLRLFGENYVQEAQEKIQRLPPDAEWHMIGHLQSNKAKRAVECFGLVQTLDRPSLADALEKAAAAQGVIYPVLFEVNVGDEDTKSGGSEEDILALAGRMAQWPHLRAEGLMALPPYLENADEVRPYLRRLHELAKRIDALLIPGVTMKEFSMGTSHDYEVAVEEGATLVRVGTALFGDRA